VCGAGVVADAFGAGTYLATSSMPLSANPGGLCHCRHKMNKSTKRSGAVESSKAESSLHLGDWQWQ
jgi:hypothetical protein